MNTQSQKIEPITVTKFEDGVEKKEVLKPCCACPDTRKLRDNCILNNGEEKCLEFIDAHKDCLSQKGFKIL